MQKQTRRLNSYKKNLCLSRSIKRKLTKIMWMVFWIKKNILLIRVTMKSRTKRSERRFGWQSRRKTALERQRNLMKTGSRSLSSMEHYPK